MGAVKKAERNVTGNRDHRFDSRKASTGKQLPRSTGRGAVSQHGNVYRRKQKSGASGRRQHSKETVTSVVFAVRALDPVSKCGQKTSVERLFRVDEKSDAGMHTHLVFLDRHGWYCEHGRECSAVVHARKFDDRASQHGPTHNGRMRA